MKRNVILLAMFFAFFSLSAKTTSDNSLQGESNTGFGNYTITKSDAVTVINNVAYQTWELSYSNSTDEFCILYAPGLEGNCCFMVRSDDFEIQYSKSDKGFGASYVDPNMRRLSKRDVMKKIDKVRLANQELITSKEKTIEEYLSLMACYVPQLVS
ncbi:MAG: hypothetical protein PF436_02950 [Prolixibacteraceae bacterium]|jgi:hypothetical protein|nr:hypothetical protein [Prolixibacteraceae bacterium]